MSDRDETNRTARSRDYGPPVDKQEIEFRLRKIEASLEWMSSSDNILAEALDELGDRIEQLESTITTAGWMKYVEDRVDRLEVTGADPQPDSDGWIPHDGGVNPVDGDTRVDIARSDGGIVCDRLADSLSWVASSSLKASGCAITHYRPAKQEAEWPQVGDAYFFICIDGQIDWRIWGNAPKIDQGTADFLGIYPTREAAEEAAAKIRRVMEHWREGNAVSLVNPRDLYYGERIKL